MIQQGHSVHSLAQVADLENLLAQLPVRGEADKGILPAGGGQLLHRKLFQQLPPGGCLVGLGLVGREPLNKGFQLCNLLLRLLVLLLDHPLHHLAGLVPELIVAHVHLDFGVVDVHNVGADIVQKMPVMGHHQHRAEVFRQKILQPADGFNVQMVRGLVQQNNVRIAEQGLSQQHLHLFVARQGGHLLVQQGLIQPQPLDQLGCIGFRLPAVQLCKFPLQLCCQLPVRLGKILLGVQSILLLHDFIQPGVAHNHRIQHRIGIIGKVILLEHGDPLGFGDDDLPGGRLQIPAENPQEGGLACTVGADDAVAVAVGEFQIHIFKEGIAPELKAYVGNSNHGTSFLRCRRGIFSHN